MIKLFYTYINSDLDFDAIYNKYSDILSKNEIRRLEKQKHNKAKLEYLFGKVITRIELSKILKIKPELIEFEKNNQGKPYLKNNKNLYFNLSHSKNMFILGVYDKEIGVDAEYKKKRDFSKIANEYFNESELVFLNESKNKLRDFYTVWTLKEGYIKYIGSSVMYLRNMGFFDYNKVKSADNFSQSFDKTAGFSVFNLGDYVLTVCYKKDYIKKITEESFPEIEFNNINYLGTNIAISPIKLFQF